MTTPECAAVEAANRAFYEAFERLDLEAMGEVWSAEEGVECVHPGWDRIRGREAVLESWRAIFASTRRIRFHLAGPRVTLHGETALVTLVERIVFGEGDDLDATEVLATNLFRLEGGRWRMILHHASPFSTRSPGEPSDN